MFLLCCVLWRERDLNTMCSLALFCFMDSHREFRNARRNWRECCPYPSLLREGGKHFIVDWSQKKSKRAFESYEMLLKLPLTLIAFLQLHSVGQLSPDGNLSVESWGSDIVSHRKPNCLCSCPVDSHCICPKNPWLWYISWEAHDPIQVS